MLLFYSKWLLVISCWLLVIATGNHALLVIIKEKETSYH